jgi:hypothetical protein
MLPFPVIRYCVNNPEPHHTKPSAPWMLWFARKNNSMRIPFQVSCLETCMGVEGWGNEIHISSSFANNV